MICKHNCPCAPYCGEAGKYCTTAVCAAPIMKLSYDDENQHRPLSAQVAAEAAPDGDVMTVYTPAIKTVHVPATGTWLVVNGVARQARMAQTVYDDGGLSLYEVTDDD